jgi:transcriptional regulator with XRE-family HTH domain
LSPRSQAGIDVEIGVRLRREREAQSVSQAVLAEWMTAIGVPASQSMVAKWERGYTPLRFREALAICQVMGISPLALSGDVQSDHDPVVMALERAKALVLAVLDADIEARKPGAKP